MFSACNAVSSTLQGRPLRPFETRKHNFYAMFGLLLRADQETTKRAIIFGVRGVAGLARTASGDGKEPRGRDGLEKGGVWVGYPKSSFCLVVWWGWWGHHAPHAKPPSFTSFRCKYMCISLYCLFFYFSLSFLFFSSGSLVFFFLAARVVLCWWRVGHRRHSTYGARYIRFFDKIGKRHAALRCETMPVL